MTPLWRTACWVTALAVAGGLPAGGPRTARAQPGFRLGPMASGSQFELADSVGLDRADSTVRTTLQRVRAYLADRQWDEAVRTLREVMENSGAKLFGVTAHRYVSVRDYCHLQLAALPPEALALYRSRVDPLAQKWYEDGIARRDRGLLLNVVEQTLASSWGDDALMALGEMALESGEYASARYFWERIIPADLPKDAPRTWLGYPDTRLDLAAVRARLVLASILEGSMARAREELERFAELHADARGRFGGRDVKYVDALREMAAAAGQWPAVPPDPDWPTLAGSPARNKKVPQPVDVGQVAWRFRLPKTAALGRPALAPDATAAGVAEDAKAPLCYHPVVVGDLVAASSQAEILACDLRTGKPAWGHGVIFRDQLDKTARRSYNPPDTLGVPRFTMTAFGGKLYARMGSAVTERPEQSAFSAPAGYVVCLDLEAEGRLVWKFTPEDKQWAPEGSPLSDGTSVFLAMRRSEIGPQVQAHVACLDGETGALGWRTYVCAAETPARGTLHQASHNLLTLAGDTLYYNTNLGAVAALSARDGRIKWVSLYPRVRQGSLVRPAAHWSRDLTPCLFDRGRLLVAPADSPRIFALDAATGQILWQTGPEVGDAVHLLGTAGDCLIAAGARIYWIATSGPQRGKVKHVFPDGPEKPGHGRGVLAGGRVYWPTRQSIYVFDQASGRQLKVIPLAPRGTTGGNLLVAGGRLLMATEDALVALASTAPAKPPDGDVAQGSTPVGRIANPSNGDVACGPAPANANTVELVRTACVAEICVKPRPVVAGEPTELARVRAHRDHWSRLYRGGRSLTGASPLNPQPGSPNHASR